MTYVISCWSHSTSKSLMCVLSCKLRKHLLKLARVLLPFQNWKDAWTDAEVSAPCPVVSMHPLHALHQCAINYCLAWHRMKTCMTSTDGLHDIDWELVCHYGINVSNWLLTCKFQSANQSSPLSGNFENQQTEYKIAKSIEDSLKWIKQNCKLTLTYVIRCVQCVIWQTLWTSGHRQCGVRSVATTITRCWAR